MGSLGLLTPWMIAAFAALPVIWILLRLTPPRPRRVDFPPTRILLGLEEREKTPARTPWWLTALRLLLAALLIAALAEPVLRPDARLTAGTDPLLIVLDNGWDSAPDFDQRVTAAETALQEARDAGRPVALVGTAETAEPLRPGDYQAAAERLAALGPRPYLPPRAELADSLSAAYPENSVEVIWIAGKVDDGAEPLAAALDQIATRGTLLQSGRPLTVMRPPENGTDAVRIPLVRIGGGGQASLAGFDIEGRRIVEGSGSFDTAGNAMIEIALPTEIRNALTRFAITNEDSAAAVQLLDGRWRRKTVGLIAGDGADGSQPLLDPLTYVERALAPSADLIKAAGATMSEDVADLIGRGASVIILTETGNLPPESEVAIATWIEAGGTLLRFASPSVAASSEDALLPVPLRQGERSLGGSLSWEEPQAIGRFSPEGPFARMAPPQDVRVNRQVLADPAALGSARVWAELADGTPLVTARDVGAGQIILFHVTADPRWSNLPLSGAFVEMLQTVVQSAGTVNPTRIAEPGGEPAAEQIAGPSVASFPWRPVQVLDGSGDLVDPDPSARVVADLSAARPSPATPPGYYDREGTTRAFNAVDADTPLTALLPATIGWSGAVAALEPQEATPIWPWLLAGACFLAILDAMAVLALSGRLAALFPRAAVLLLAILIGVPLADPARAQETSADDAMESVLTTRLGYVLTGNEAVDQTSLDGLRGLTMYLGQRTALEPGEPMGIDVASDELAFYALLYWPIEASAPVPSGDTMARVDEFLRNGGTVLFDTRDAGGFMAPGNAVSPETQKLREILSFVDVPPLEPVPPDHVLTKSFFLLSEFPGRWSGSDLWVESIEGGPQDPNRPVRGGDGVSPILITGNDLAAAWAIDDANRFVYPTVPADPRQRELAFRSGVNIVMYTLTGNYKADQVHIPALLERLGQ